MRRMPIRQFAGGGGGGSLTPNLSFNEERPQFIGKDVEGIKELNAVLAKKYDINKQAHIQTEDLLHSFRTLEEDQPHLTEAIEGFDEEMQFITDNNQYERAGQIVEKAVTNIKRNKALEQSVANYGTAQTYINELKENPNGWDEAEITSVIGYSNSRYNGVTLDENGDATGTYYGYQPGEKINVLTEFDEALKGFAADTGTSIGAVYNMLNDGTQKAYDTETVTEVDRDELITYLKQYYDNDPRINKYYETKNIIDSRKGGVELSNELKNNIGKLDILAQYGPQYRKYLKAQGITPETQSVEEVEFVEWMLNREGGTQYDLEGLMEIASREDEDSADAKQILAGVNSMLNKSFDFEAAAIKNSFKKSEIRRSMFDDQMTLYRLKKLEENNEALYVFNGNVLDNHTQYIDDRGTAGYENLNSQVDSLNTLKEVNSDAIIENLNKAAGAGDYDNFTGLWTNPNSEFKNYDTRLKNEKIIYDREIADKEVYLNAANEYADNKAASNPNILTNEQITQKGTDITNRYNQQIADLTAELDDSFKNANTPAKYLTPGQRFTKENLLKNYKNELILLDDIGIERYATEIKKRKDELHETNFSTAFIPEGINRIVKDVTSRGQIKTKDKYRQEYLNNNSIKTYIPRIVRIDENSNKGLINATDAFEYDYALTASQHVTRNRDGNIISDPKDRPVSVNVTGMSTGRFGDGQFYYEAVGEVINDDGKRVTARDKDGRIEKYYIAANESTVSEDVGNRLINNSTPEAAALGYQLITPLGFRFETEGIDLVNNNVPIISNDGNELGEVKIESSKTNGIPDFQSIKIKVTLPQNILNSAKKLYPNIEKDVEFANRATLEEFLNNVNVTVNSDKN